MRIISLVPSITELLFDLHLEEEVVGITKFCIHPTSWFRNKTRVGGTKKIDRQKILDLKPDLVLANKEENTQEDIEFLQEFVPVYVSEIDNLETALQMILTVGELTQRTEEAAQLVQHIQSSFATFLSPAYGKALYFIWQNPYMVAGQNTFIHSMMKLAGFENGCPSSRYPSYNIDALRALEPEFLLLSSEPIPFGEKHRAEFEELFPQTKVILVDGEIFSWYGSRMLRAIDYFRTLNEQILS